MKPTHSCAYLPGDRSDDQMEDDIEVMIHCLVRDMPMSAMRQEQIRAAAAEDPDLQMLRQAAMMGWPKKKHSAQSVLQDYLPVKDEVHIADGLLCVGDRIVIPSSLKSEMLALLHESHMGAEKTKARAAGALFWPNMTADNGQLCSLPQPEECTSQGAVETTPHT